jgi:branched-chain amino acid transport system substrate-binding protein
MYGSMAARALVLTSILALSTIAIDVQAAEQPPIRIGEISSYSALPVGTRGYRQGWELAQDQINARGGVLGRKLEIIARDDAGKPDVAIAQANQLVESERVDLLTGTILSHVGLAVADFAKQKKIFFLASQPLTDALIWEKGSRFTFRLRASTFTQAAILAKEAARFPARRWATIAPNYEFGQSAVANFKSELKRLRPDVEFVSEHWPPLNKIDAGAVIQAVMGDKPDAIFNATFGSDLARLVREGTTRNAFAGRNVVSILTGEPEYLAPLKEEAPVGWLVTGYPWSEIRTSEHDAFLKAYLDRYKEPPNIGALIGYINTTALARGIEAAGSTNTDDLIKAMEQLKVDTPVGKVAFRANDHQSTMGVYIGRIAIKDGQGVMTDWSYVDGAGFQPSDAEVASKRKD